MWKSVRFATDLYPVDLPGAAHAKLCVTVSQL